MNKNTKNILSVFEQATDAERVVGMNWYFRANSDARTFSRSYSLPVKVTAGVLAALSPNQSWRNNTKASAQVFLRWNQGESLAGVPAYPASIAKAESILKGGNPGDILKGLKTTSFYNNIVSPWTSSSVTVDGHGYSIWNGKRTTLETTPSRIFRPKWYNTIAADYKTVAAELGIRPNQVQAVTWVAWRRIIGVQKQGLYDL
jgi:hypothetical protein